MAPRVTDLKSGSRTATSTAYDERATVMDEALVRVNVAAQHGERFS